MPSFTPRPAGNIKILIVPITVLLGISALGAYFFFRGQTIMEQQLRKQLSSAAAVGALQFDAKMLEEIKTEKDEQKDAYRTVVNKLHDIKYTVPNVRFAYIMRKTSDPMQLVFVADADALSPLRELDADFNGNVDEYEEPSHPGDAYDISEVPALQRDAFVQPTTDQEITVDQWGQLISGYAPIRDASGRVVAVLGIDMHAEEFISLSRSVFSPVAFLLVIVAGVGVAAYIMRVTWIRRIEALHQLEAERTALLDLASHQLGGPLTMFKWWLEILREQDDGKFCKRGGVCDQMQQGIDRMDGIIRSLRSAAQFHKGNFTYTPKRVELAPIFKDVVNQVVPIMNLRHQEFSQSVAEKLPMITFDPELLTGVIQELLDNASAYSQEGASISLRAAKSEGGVLIEVEDNGHGIPAKDLPHMFEKFRRGSNAMLYKPVGNGLGLSIASGIIRRAKGKMWVRSVEGKGSLFSVWLPAA